MVKKEKNITKLITYTPLGVSEHVSVFAHVHNTVFAVQNTIKKSKGKLVKRKCYNILNTCKKNKPY